MPDICEVKVLGYEKATVLLCRIPNAGVRSPAQPFLRHRIHVVPQILQGLHYVVRHIFVELDLH